MLRHSIFEQKPHCLKYHLGKNFVKTGASCLIFHSKFFKLGEMLEFYSMLSPSFEIRLFTNVIWPT